MSDYDIIEAEVEPLYGNPLMSSTLPTDQLPKRSTPARVAHQMIKDELTLDGNPKMNVSLRSDSE
jgi:glutamate decarboxylase